MAHRISVRLTQALLGSQLIDFDDVDYAVFYFENLMLKVIAVLLTIIISVLTDSMPGLLVYFVFYTAIRKYSGGFHCKTSFGCFLLSTILLLSIVLIRPFVADINRYWGVCLMSSLVILITGTVNHPNLVFEESELSILKTKSRLVTILESLIFTLMIILNVNKDFVFYIGMAMPINAISIIVSKLTGQEVTNKA